ncbi:MAG: HAD-superfamily hydrolase, subfamily IA, variant 3 [uncultured bacterium (gcode 4)]|uniref:HAD-superfamily hydrolase, subfamily IA, variant 3 n=1 Tax=uncultured bacterium (gcode 4) TaxID=1234023 RepID=K2G6T6_9BACT|nr:MAG: HAD-superfamily hydrolase, subfamily IA, variant 3 [uncultured bacterium (gcode 4)]
MQKHIVFDLDWTLSDTQKIHEKVESDFLKSKWIDIEPSSIWKKYAWRTPQEWIWELLSEENIAHTKEELEDFVSRKDETVISLLEKWEIELMPHARESLELLLENGYRIWISSWACREFIDKFIVHFGLENIIMASTSANEVMNKKPNPDVFLSSFDKLEKIFWISELRYVVWDGWSDVEWWHRSWAKTIWLNYNKKQRQNPDLCDFEIESLKEMEDILILKS